MRAAKSPLLLLNTADVAKLLGVSRPTIYAWVRRGRFLPPLRFGAPRWERDALLAWLRAEQQRLASFQKEARRE